MIQSKIVHRAWPGMVGALCHRSGKDQFISVYVHPRGWRWCKKCAREHRKISLSQAREGKQG